MGHPVESAEFAEQFCSAMQPESRDCKAALGRKRVDEQQSGSFTTQGFSALFSQLFGQYCSKNPCCKRLKTSSLQQKPILRFCPKRAHYSAGNTAAAMYTDNKSCGQLSFQAEQSLNVAGYLNSGEVIETLILSGNTRSIHYKKHPIRNKVKILRFLRNQLQSVNKN